MNLKRCVSDHPNSASVDELVRQPKPQKLLRSDGEANGVSAVMESRSEPLRACVPQIGCHVGVVVLQELYLRSAKQSGPCRGRPPRLEKVGPSWDPRLLLLVCHIGWPHYLAKSSVSLLTKTTHSVQHSFIYGILFVYIVCKKHLKKYMYQKNEENTKPNMTLITFSIYFWFQF